MLYITTSSLLAIVVCHKLKVLTVARSVDLYIPEDVAVPEHVTEPEHASVYKLTSHLVKCMCHYHCQSLFVVLSDVIP